MLESSEIIVGLHAPLHTSRTPPVDTSGMNYIQGCAAVRSSQVEQPTALSHAGTNLSVRALNILEDLGVESVEQVRAMTPDQLLEVGRHRHGSLQVMRQVAMFIQHSTGRNPWEPTA